MSLKSLPGVWASKWRRAHIVIELGPFDPSHSMTQVPLPNPSLKVFDFLPFFYRRFFPLLRSSSLLSFFTVSLSSEARSVRCRGERFCCQPYSWRSYTSVTQWRVTPQRDWSTFYVEKNLCCASTADTARSPRGQSNNLCRHLSDAILQLNTQLTFIQNIF